MSDAKLFAITGFNGGVSVGVQGDTPEEFAALVQAVRVKAVSDPVLAQLFAPVIGQVTGSVPPSQGPDEAQAIANLQAAGMVSTVGQPLPQPTVVAQPVAQPTTPTAPPNVPYPGDCAHGRRVYVDKQARGKPWRRWECSIPWSKGAQGRCDPINVEN